MSVVLTSPFASNCAISSLLLTFVPVKSRMIWCFKASVNTLDGTTSWEFSRNNTRPEWGTTGSPFTPVMLLKDKSRITKLSGKMKCTSSSLFATFKLVNSFASCGTTPEMPAAAALMVLSWDMAKGSNRFSTVLFTGPSHGTEVLETRGNLERCGGKWCLRTV